MRLFEFTQQFDPLLLDFWKQATPEQMSYYCVQDNCFGASQDFEEFLSNQGYGNAEIVPIGHIRGGHKTGGWIFVDVADTSIDALEKKDVTAMREQGLDPRKKADRIAYIQNNGLEEEFRWIPHSWVEIRGRILDPSGFMPDGRTGQFDRMVKDKTNLSSRYRVF